MYIYDYKVSDSALGPKFQWQSVSTIEPPFRTRTGISARLPKYIHEFSYCLRGSRAQKDQFQKQNMFGYAAYVFLNFSIFERQFPDPICKKARAIECTIQN